MGCFRSRAFEGAGLPPLGVNLHAKSPVYIVPGDRFPSPKKLCPEWQVKGDTWLQIECLPIRRTVERLRIRLTIPLSLHDSSP